MRWGVLSLVFWSLAAIVGLKYAVLMMRADNQGEGGIMALRNAGENARRMAILAAGLTGTALFFGDGIITPAISVMSVVEDLKIMAPGLGPAVVPPTLAMLVALFLLQHRGTAFIGDLFSPIMSVWFIALVLLGPSPQHHPDPGHPERAESRVRGKRFLLEAEWHSLRVLGAVVLAVTGAKA